MVYEHQQIRLRNVSATIPLIINLLIQRQFCFKNAHLSNVRTNSRHCEPQTGCIGPLGPTLIQQYAVQATSKVPTTTRATIPTMERKPSPSDSVSGAGVITGARISILGAVVNFELCTKKWNDQSREQRDNKGGHTGEELKIKILIKISVT